MIKMHVKFSDTFSGLSNIPQELKESLWLYMCYGLQPGGFMTSFLSNDLYTASCRAHPSLPSETFRSLAIWLINFAPPMSYGSEEVVAKWMSRTDNERHTIMMEYDLRPTVVEILKGDYTA